MEKTIAVMDGGKKYGVGVVEQTLVLLSMSHRGVRGGRENSSVEGGILTIGEGVRNSVSMGH